jgi:hypothetical protein
MERIGLWIMQRIGSWIDRADQALERAQTETGQGPEKAPFGVRSIKSPIRVFLVDDASCGFPAFAPHAG